jgi:RNA-dependent RNA polymerase
MIAWTQSQLKSSSMWFTLDHYKHPYLGARNRDEIIKFLGEFEAIKNPALKAARIGQALSTGRSVDLGDVNLEFRNDEIIGKYLYTDGIGMISSDLVEKVKTKLQIQGSALQIRYLGCKGLLVVNRLLQPKTIVVRKSMKKYECPSEARKYFDVLDYNCFKPGYLNRQIIILLSSNGVSDGKLLELQRDYITAMLKSGLRKGRGKFEEILGDHPGEFQLAHQAMSTGVGSIGQFLKPIV